jgi:putative ABC transport system permease protein
MDLVTGIRVALRALGGNKMRSALTMLGICIGVAAYICSVAIGQGSSSQIERQIHNLGDDMIWIEAGGRNVNGVRTGTHGTKSLTVEDARAIQQQIPLVMNVSPHVDTNAQIMYQNQNWFTRVRGVAPEYLAVRRWRVARGNFFSQDDVAYGAKFCVLGQTAAANLFGREDPLGKTIRVKRIPCRIIGVLDVKGQSPRGRDQDDVLLMPFTTVQKQIKGIYWVDDIMCSAVSPLVIASAERQITALLRERHHLVGNQANDFNLRHPVDILKARAKAKQTMTILMGSIAAIALVVAGTGIMNIMLASVAERTREIGIRLAVGARKRDILFQFLVEAVILSLIGGGIGIGLGLVGSYSIGYFAHWRTLISPLTIVVAFGFAGAVGIFFGFYPAQRAARLDPIDALTR